MGSELTKFESGLVSKASADGMSELLKPLSREIHLFDSYVAGTSHLKDGSVLDAINRGDMLFMVREDNKFDSNAIMFLTTDKRKLGYVPEKDNIVFARLMDAGKKLSAKITDIDKKGSFTKIAVSIFLIDY